MMHRFRIAALAAASLWLAVTPVSAQVTDPNKDEAKCETATGKALNKFVASSSKCVAKCVATARKVMGPYGPCFGNPPTDPATNACLNDPAKGALAKTRASIGKACAVDCPECYTAQGPNTCTTGDPLVSTTVTNSTPFGPLVYCTEGLGGTPSKEVAKCEDTVGKALVKFISSKSKCYEKCNASVLKGTLPQGSCDPPSPLDAKTAACIFDPLKGAEAKAAASIDKACASAGFNPACYAPLFDTGVEWVAIVEASVDASLPNVACGSPSGAFLQ
jgi:hypothetical protein